MKLNNEAPANLTRNCLQDGLKMPHNDCVLLDWFRLLSTSCSLLSLFLFYHLLQKILPVAARYSSIIRRCLCFGE